MPWVDKTPAEWSQIITLVSWWSLPLLLHTPSWRAQGRTLLSWYARQTVQFQRLAPVQRQHDKWIIPERPGLGLKIVIGELAAIICVMTYTVRIIKIRRMRGAEHAAWIGEITWNFYTHRCWDTIKTKLESKMTVREYFFYYNSAKGHMVGCCEEGFHKMKKKTLHPSEEPHRKVFTYCTIQFVNAQQSSTQSLLHHNITISIVLFPLYKQCLT